jgi:hypothetical protein
VSDKEDFLSRWALRKQAVADAEAAKTAKPSPPERSAPPEAENVQSRKPADGPHSSVISPGEVGVDPLTLPSLDSITAETDIRAFLAPGVPADLARAALRRAWSTDPAIRDFIGLSENLSETAWDFSSSESIAGFGPLELTDDLRRAVAQMFTPMPQSASQHIETTKVSAPTDNSESASSKQHIAFPQDESVSLQDESSIRDQSSQVSNAPDAVQQEPVAQSDKQTTVRRSHGRALPK